MSKVPMKSVVVILFVLIIPALLLYNLDTSPRPWHDEGNAMLLARTLAEDGVYSVRTSTGYQTFGAVQSIGPTVVLPVALSFKVFGVGIFQGRLIAVVYSYLTLLSIYKLTKAVFNRFAAVMGLLILLGSASAQFLYFGRQVLGEVPALGFFLGGWYFWLTGRQGKGKIYYGLSGILIGLSMVTKSSYAVIGGLLFVALGLLDLFYYRQRSLVSLIVVAGAAFIVFSLWVVFQRVYFGLEVFQGNLDLMGQLGQATTGFSINTFVQQARFLIGFKNDYFYFLWGIPAILYAVVLCLRKDEYGFLTSVLTIFTILWLMYYFYSVPWPSYLFASAAIVALFAGKLWFDILSKVKIPLENIFDDMLHNRDLAALGLFVAFLAGVLLVIFYPLQNAIQFNVLNKDLAPEQVADYLNREVPMGETLETWERELGILTSHSYHFPDQSLLIEVHSSKYRGNTQKYLLGNEYFEKVKPSFIIIGWYARDFPVYDPLFLSTNTSLVAHIGNEGPGFYEIYKVNYPLVVSK